VITDAERHGNLDTASSGGGSRVIVIMVRDVMTRRPVTIGPETLCDEARRLMDEHRIRHLPVVAGGRLIGMLSDRDVRSAASGSPGSMAGRIMTPDPATVNPDARIEHAARLMLDARFGSLPVVDASDLVGIVTYTDLLRAFVRVIETATLERITVELG
jgi:acetoin utilization protein AcuB